MAQADWGGTHAVYSRGPEARSYAQPQARPGQGQYGQPAQYYTPRGYAAYEPEPEIEAPVVRGEKFAKAMTMLGAGVSLALIVGLGVWGYKLAVRDVTGVPVVRALEGPMRIRPEDPGGLAVAHQGLAVNEVAADGGAAPVPEQVTLAPAPASLDAEDLPVHDETELAAAVSAEAGEMLPAEIGAPVAMDASADNDAVARALAMANALAAASAPLSGEEADLSMTPTAAATLSAASVPVSVPGVALSPRPQPRPASLVTRVAATPAQAAPAAASGAREIAASEIPAGTRLVQLGAFDSEAVAREEWAKISAQFSDVLDGKSRVIEKAQSGGKTFYRLRAMGFADLSDARRFCAALMAGQAACIPVVTR